jgi:hypothetical protein
LPAGKNDKDFVCSFLVRRILFNDTNHNDTDDKKLSQDITVIVDVHNVNFYNVIVNGSCRSWWWRQNTWIGTTERGTDADGYV